MEIVTALARVAYHIIFGVIWAIGLAAMLFSAAFITFIIWFSYLS